MSEKKAIGGILLIMAVSIAAYLVITSGSTGAAVNSGYIACCCNTLSSDGQMFVRSQVQTFADSCQEACGANTRDLNSKVFAQDGLCEANP